MEFGDMLIAKRKKYADTDAEIVTGTHTAALAGGQRGYRLLLPSLLTVLEGAESGCRHSVSQGT